GYSLQAHSGAFWAVILAPIREFIIPAAGYSLQAHSGAFWAVILASIRNSLFQQPVSAVNGPILSPTV
ncbi:hypothetical protein, partial [Paenibacillus elgii]|uniref:hypothetical protein n=1 Tax=Paenibacillus elgii TaxID=189691 RepID=UPI00203D86B0